MIDEADQGGEAPCWAHFLDDLDQQSTPPLLSSSNTIIYCSPWPDVVAFYRDRLGLRVTMERDWFVEFALHPGAHLSVADAERATVAAADGSGLTLSWQVDDLATAQARLAANAVEMTPIRSRWGTDTFFVFDPAGNRIEFWADAPETTG